MKMQMYVLGFLAFGLSLFLLSNFILIWQTGQVRINDPSPMVLLADTAIVVAALAFSLYCMAKYLIQIGAPRR